MGFCQAPHPGEKAGQLTCGCSVLRASELTSPVPNFSPPTRCALAIVGPVSARLWVISRQRNHHFQIFRSSNRTIFLETITALKKPPKWSRRERTTAATRRAAATSSPSAAPTARDALPRIRPSSGSPSATWLSPQPSVISRTPPCSPSIRFPRCTSSCSTVSLAPFTARLSVSAPARAAATVLLPRVSGTTRTARRSCPLWVLRPLKVAT